MLNIQDVVNEYQLNLNSPTTQRFINGLCSEDPGYNNPGSSFEESKREVYAMIEAANQREQEQQNMNTMYAGNYNNGISYQNPFNPQPMYAGGYSPINYQYPVNCNNYNNGINYQNPFNQQNYNTYPDRNSIPQDLNNFDDINFFMELPNLDQVVNTGTGTYVIHGWYDDTMYGGFIDQTGKYIPCRYDCETYNQALYRKYLDHGSKPMYINWATGYKKYNPMHDYCYRPSAKEYELAYNYFQEMYPDFGTFAVSTADKKYHEWAEQFDNQCSPSTNQQNPYAPQSQPYIVTDTMPCDYELSDDQFHDVARQLYQNNMISLNEYTAVANGGIEYTTDNGTTVNQNIQYENNTPTYSPFGWGGYGYNPQYYQQLQEQQQAYYQHTEAMNMAFNVARRFNGITDEEIMMQQAEQARQYQEQMQMMAKQYEKAQYEWSYDTFANDVNNAPCSDQKDYVSPLKAQYMNHYNKVYEDRHKRVDSDMSFEDFMINGGYAEILFDDIRYENRKEIHKLAREFDTQAHREFMHQNNPWYDPVTGTVPIRDLKLGRNDIEISLTTQERVELAASYEARRRAFYDSINAGHQHAPISDISYLNSQYDPTPTRMNFLSRHSLGQQLMSL